MRRIVAFAFGCLLAGSSYAAGPYDVKEGTIPQTGPALSSPINRGAGTTAARPALGPYQDGYYDDTTLGERVYWDGRTGKWRGRHGYEK